MHQFASRYSDKIGGYINAVHNFDISETYIVIFT